MASVTGSDIAVCLEKCWAYAGCYYATHRPDESLCLLYQTCSFVKLSTDTCPYCTTSILPQNLKSSRTEANDAIMMVPDKFTKTLNCEISCKYTYILPTIYYECYFVKCDQCKVAMAHPFVDARGLQIERIQMTNSFKYLFSYIEFQTLALHKTLMLVIR